MYESYVDNAVCSRSVFSASNHYFPLYAFQVEFYNAHFFSIFYYYKSLYSNITRVPGEACVVSAVFVCVCVCVCVCLSVCLLKHLKNYASESNRTRQEYVLCCPLKVMQFW